MNSLSIYDFNKYDRYAPRSHRFCHYMNEINIIFRVKWKYHEIGFTVIYFCFYYSNYFYSYRWYCISFFFHHIVNFIIRSTIIHCLLENKKPFQRLIFFSNEVLIISSSIKMEILLFNVIIEGLIMLSSIL